MKIFYFSQNFPNFFFNFSFYAIAQKCRLQQSWARHKKTLSMALPLDGYMKALRFIFFVTIPTNEK